MARMATLHLLAIVVASARRAAVAYPRAIHDVVDTPDARAPPRIVPAAGRRRVVTGAGTGRRTGAAHTRG